MKKSICFTIGVLLIVMIMGSVVSAGPRQNQYNKSCPYYQQQPNMTAEQQQEMTTLRKQMLENKKQMLNKQVQWGNMTQTQADEIITNMEQCIESQTCQNGIGICKYGMGHGKGMRAGCNR